MRTPQILNQKCLTPPGPPRPPPNLDAGWSQLSAGGLARSVPTSKLLQHAPRAVIGDHRATIGDHRDTMGDYRATTASNYGCCMVISLDSYGV